MGTFQGIRATDLRIGPPASRMLLLLLAAVFEFIKLRSELEFGNLGAAKPIVRFLMPQDGVPIRPETLLVGST
jgi:hypothetical protein